MARREETTGETLILTFFLCRRGLDVARHVVLTEITGYDRTSGNPIQNTPGDSPTNVQSHDVGMGLQPVRTFFFLLSLIFGAQRFSQPPGRIPDSARPSFSLIQTCLPSLSSSVPLINVLPSRSRSSPRSFLRTNALSSHGFTSPSSSVAWPSASSTLAIRYEPPISTILPPLATLTSLVNRSEESVLLCSLSLVCSCRF
jgi:hypothetical protein